MVLSGLTLSKVSRCNIFAGIGNSKLAAPPKPPELEKVTSTQSCIFSRTFPVPLNYSGVASRFINAWYSMESRPVSGHPSQASYSYH